MLPRVRARGPGAEVEGNPRRRQAPPGQLGVQGGLQGQVGPAGPDLEGRQVRGHRRELPDVGIRPQIPELPEGVLRLLDGVERHAEATRVEEIGRQVGQSQGQVGKEGGVLFRELPADGYRTLRIAQRLLQTPEVPETHDAVGREVATSGEGSSGSCRRSRTSAGAPGSRGPPRWRPGPPPAGLGSPARCPGCRGPGRGAHRRPPLPSRQGAAPGRPPPAVPTTPSRARRDPNSARPDR